MCNMISQILKKIEYKISVTGSLKEMDYVNKDTSQGGFSLQQSTVDMTVNKTKQSLKL